MKRDEKGWKDAGIREREREDGGERPTITSWQSCRHHFASVLPRGVQKEEREREMQLYM
jgi:hypothetical protein